MILNNRIRKRLIRIFSLCTGDDQHHGGDCLHGEQPVRPHQVRGRRDGHLLRQVPLQVIIQLLYCTIKRRPFSMPSPSSGYYSLFSWLTIWAVSVIILPSNLGRGLYICSTVINLGLFIGTAGSTRGTLCASLPCSLTLTRYTGTSPPFILGVSSILFPLPHPPFLEIKILSPLLK